ncbi:MAG: zinc ribbon domain-containing protein [Candidatus Helarchaeota archaeon]
MYRRIRHPHLGPRPPVPPIPTIIPIPMRQVEFKELRHIFILWILKDQPKGITGYQLQELYNMPRGNMLRILTDLEIQEYVKTTEKVVKGRVQKLYLITKKGENYLEKLRDKWAEKFTVMGEMAPPDKFGHPFHRENKFKKFIDNLDKLKTRQDALDYFHGLRHRFKNVRGRLQNRLENIDFILDQLDKLIPQIESMDEYSQDKIKTIIESLRQRFQGHDFNGSYCSNCGTKLTENALYCSECGNRVI